MSTRVAEWCSLQPSVRSRDEAFPVTLLPLLPNEAVDESSSIIECSTLLNVSCLKGLKTRDGFNSLIDSYSRWIMTVTDQTHIAFLITEWEEGPVPKCAVVSAQRQSEYEILEWAAYKTSSEDLTPEEERLEFSLCLSHKPAIEKLVKETATSFWEKALEGFAGLNEIQFPTLSGMRARDSTTSPACITKTLDIKISWERVEDLAQKFGLRSGISVVRAAFAYTLAEYMETDRIILGDQDLADMSRENSVNLIPFRVLLDDTSETILRRDEEFVPYNALFAYEQNVVPEQDRKSSHDASRSLAAPIELILRKLEQGQPACTLSSGSLLMDLSHLELVLQQINSLIAAMCSSPTERIRDLAQLFPKELLSLHSAAASDNLQRAPLLSPAHWVDKWAAYNPSWVGLEILDAISKDNTVSRTWTYRDLSHTSDQLCTWLAGHGWCNRSIAVCLDRSFMAYCLVLAIWKSGNCYVPIAEDLPVARQLFLLSDSGATAFFVDKWASKSLLSPENCEVIDIDGLELPGNPDVVDKISVNPKPSDDCYLLYTSGSTGTPKGVLVSRGNLSAFTEAQSEYICHEVPDTPGLKGTGSYLAHASRAFDVHICEMVLGWRHGLRLVTGQRDMLLDNLFLVLSCLKITHAGFVPSLLEHAEVSAESLPDLRYLGVGGENISETIIERFVGKQSIALINAYGPTEATIGFTSHTVKPWSTVRNIGTAVGNITIHVFEPETTKYTKRGQAGELCVTGDLVANGYHRRPNATGFTNLDGQRMYRTGDIVRLMANNCIEYLGRRDSQAKIRGQRLELEEVSIAVRRCARFPVQVTSMVTPSPITKRPQLVSFISPIGGRPYSTGVKVKFLKDRYQEWVPKILESCRIELPAYMVPSVLLPVSTIPVQISGKADKRHLVALYESIPISDLLLGPRETAMADLESISELDAAHLTAEQMKIRDILCTLVDADQKSVTKATNIFQLGIDSLDSLSVAAKLRRVGYVCSAADILGKSIAQLALLPRSYTIQDQGHRENFSEAQKTEASRRLEQLDQEFRNSQTQISNSCVAIVRPCLPLQESIVSTSIGSPIPLYVNHILCRLGKGITLKNLKLAFEDLMQHNEVLRTCFHIANNKIFQVVLKPRVVEIHWDEVVVSDENVARRLFNTRQTETASSIIRNIETKPPFHILAAFPVCEEEPGWFMLSIHHSIFDGASMGLLVKQLHHHYTGATSMIASKASTTAAFIVETAWAAMLAKCLRQRDVIFGRVMDGRSIPVESVEKLLVPLVTTVPGRFRLPSQRTSLLRQAKLHTDAMLESLPYQHTPLRAIQRYTQAPGPLFNTLISYIPIGPRSSAENMLFEMDNVMPANYPLALEAKADSHTDTITLRLRISNALSSSERYGSLIDKVSTLLSDLIADEDIIIDATGSFESRKKEKPTWDETQWTEDEEKIRRAVSEVSGLSDSQVSKNASFFALGIDSVVSIHLARCLKKENIDASPSDILRYPSIGALHNHFKQPRAVSVRKEALEKLPEHNMSADLFDPNDLIVEMYPCTPLQTAMIGQSLGSEGKEYLHHHVVTLSGSVDLEKLVTAWQHTVGDADILRTSFHRQGTNNQFYVAVHKYPTVQLSHQPNSASLPEAIEKISREASYARTAAFRVPPWYVTFITGESQRLMVVTMHHCLYDGFSLPLLFSSLERRYFGYSDPLGSFAPAARDIAAKQGTSMKFWTHVLSNYQYPGLPLSCTNIPNVRWAEIRVQTPVPELQRRCVSIEVTLQSVALLAFGRSLMPMIGQRDVVFGHVVSGRGFDIDPSMTVIGPLFNTVPFRLRLESANQSVRSALQDIQHFSLNSQPYHHASLSLIQKDWRLKNRRNGSSLFDTLFTFNKYSEFSSESIFQAYDSSLPPDAPHYSLNVEFDQRADSLVIRTISHDFPENKNGLKVWTENLALGIENILSSSDAPALSFPPGIDSLPLVTSPRNKTEEYFEDDPTLETYLKTLMHVLSEVTGVASE
ncbi:uncharacterized protein N7443_005163 [Penicillium atrosanguineum]|uniref:uncharacterized protein n=1 Tax=Penicillium atrosanguineum TaxID=1132637 RepID=UPI002387F565|nr:uncharacterized protein N7443_005163 [Penicillium atrosanguineum]KAJ5305503.1 hypothetical protein N7443_005163 [Penicillium atrosanguineum]